LLFGKYLLEQKLGEGGMGDVWLVENIELDRETALKLIKADIVRNDKVWRRFRREARLMAKLNHPNAVAVYDFKRTHSIGYIEMEFVRGRSLDKHLAERNGEPMSPAWTAQILDQLCSVLQEAHGYVDEKKGKAKPIIHRDLKPSNLMLVDKKPPGQNLKVLDFGIAKMIEDEGNPEVTGAGDFLGTPAYMSPEQIPGATTKEGRREIDARSDLYSVGVILYEFLAGHRPFQGPAFKVMHDHAHTPPPPFSRKGPVCCVPPEVERVVMRCLEKDPDKRPQTARELAEQFRAAIPHAAGTTPKPFRWRRVAVSALCVVLLVLTAGVIRRIMVSPTGSGAGSGGGHGNTPPPEPPPSQPSPPGVWLPEGYVVAEPFEPAPDAPDEAMSIRRISSNVEFKRLKTGAYIPVNYEPESSDMSDLEESLWPRVIVRTTDKKVRFIRIPGKTYHMGDPRPSRPATDSQQNPCTPHWVHVAGFYIQETEVTHDEIEDYLVHHQDAADNLRTWKAYHKRLRDRTKPEEKAKNYPAVCISYVAARRYAEDMSGRLPTEAEWEYAAKSCNDDFVFPWGKLVPGKGAKPKANLLNQNGFTGGPAEVKSFPDDRTHQNVLDLAGNVREFCLDAYEPYAKIINPGNSTENPLPDPGVRVDPRPDTQTKYVVRGGSFQLSLQKAMAFQRDRVSAEEPLDDIGLRIVIECPPAR